MFGSFLPSQRSSTNRWRPELNAVITVGSGQFTIAEAMYEIVRSALAALSNQSQVLATHKWTPLKRLSMCVFGGVSLAQSS